MKWPAFALLGAGIASGMWVSGYRETINPAVQGAGLETHEQSAGASLLGQFRTSAASNLYLRTDLYLHGGVELRPKTEQEIRAGKAGSDLKPGEEPVLGDESHLVTSIPSKEEDFRGIFGDLERATSAYQDMHHHTHNDAETAFPLFRLMTWVDPQFLTGWTTGAMLLGGSKSKDAANRALAFLEEGLRANPDSYEIMTRIGVIKAARLNDIPGGMQWFEKARLAARKQGKLSPEQMDSLVETYRWLAIVANRLGDTQRLRKVIEEGLALFPEDQIMLRFAKQLGMVVKLPVSSSSQNLKGSQGVNLEHADRDSRGSPDGHDHGGGPDDHDEH